MTVTALRRLVVLGAIDLQLSCILTLTRGTSVITENNGGHRQNTKSNHQTTHYGTAHEVNNDTMLQLTTEANKYILEPCLQGMGAPQAWRRDTREAIIMLSYHGSPATTTMTQILLLLGCYDRVS